MPQVLVIEDEPLLARSICESLHLAGYTSSAVGCGEDGLEAAAKNPPDIILLDLRLPGIDGIDVLRELRRRGSSASVITMTAYGHIDGAVEAIKGGASDYLTKPLDLKELELVIERVLRHQRLAANLDYIREREREASAFERIIGESAPMQAVKRLIQRFTTTPALSSKFPPTVLLTGETGTGKDLVARAIHYGGPRREGPFVPVNCTALPEHLVEAELFGHVKGAFTDARGDKRGLFEVADGGTLFLDEIGHMKLSLQAKLLGALEERSIRPIGGTSERKIDVHVIAATNRDLETAIRAGEFRDDLYHRLRVLTIELPPLRERNGDVEALAEHFLRLYTARFALPVEGFTSEALEEIRRYAWTGNVRELSHTIENAVLIADSPYIRPEDLNIRRPANNDISAAPRTQHEAAAASGHATLDIQHSGGQTIVIDFTAPAECPKLEDIEYQVMGAALAHCKFNLSRAARLLGISRDAIRYRMERYEKAREAAAAGEPAG